MLCWRSGLGSIFGLENVRSRVAVGLFGLGLFTLVQPNKQKLN